MARLDWMDLYLKVAAARFSLGEAFIYYETPTSTGISVRCVYMRGASVQPNDPRASLYSESHNVEDIERLQFLRCEVTPVVGALVVQGNITFRVDDIDQALATETDMVAVVVRVDG